MNGSPAGCCPAPIVLLWDGLPAHKSTRILGLIAVRPWLRVYRLPGCAPELNSVESMWSSLNRGMANLAHEFLDTSGLAPPGP
ncbi:transposase [Actinoplanes hulinensis]|uniref:Transposase n=1 Tax=Actinoplanes hulinensis TaxID=1144547 RepID=A0ABS7AYA9_9ACTN|nr:transposase [Actinoplanes hulinensis]MBW6433672.1 transposase [Actinoplanes hulinensis]